MTLKKNRWILLDCNYLCHRAKHSTGGLSHNNKPTGVIYGFLRSLEVLQDRLQSNRFVFCWDSRYCIRQRMYPSYKANRLIQNSEKDEDQITLEVEFREQMRKLRTKYLPTIGFRNVFCQRGYEADDIIASVLIDELLRHPKNQIVIVSADHDLYQLLYDNVWIYHPQLNKVITRTTFIQDYGIVPEKWAAVKAIAGCPTDNIKGVPGVGEKTAIKYLTKKLSKTTKAYRNIKQQSPKDYFFRVALTTLPLDGCRQFNLKSDQLSQQGWTKVVEMLGMKSLRDRLPIRR